MSAIASYRLLWNPSANQGKAFVRTVNNVDIQLQVDSIAELAAIGTILERRGVSIDAGGTLDTGTVQPVL